MYGIILGHYLPSIEYSVKKLPRLTRFTLWWIVILGMIVSYVSVIIWMNIITIDWSPPGVPVAYLPYFDKASLAIGRLFFGISWFLGLYLIFRKYEDPINHYTKGLLLVFGQNSLFVYSLQAFIIFGIDVIFPSSYHLGIVINTVIYLSVVVLVYFIIKTRFKALHQGKNFVQYLHNKASL